MLIKSIEKEMELDFDSRTHPSWKILFTTKLTNSFVEAGMLPKEY